MKLDLQAGQIVEPGVGQFFQSAAIKMSGRERHRRAVGEIDIAQHPSGVRRPRQHAKRRGIGDHEKIAAAFHFRHAEAAARGEHGKHGLVRGVLGEQRGGNRAAVAHERGRLTGDHRLAAQNAVLVRKREPDHFELMLLDQLVGFGRRRELRIVP